LFTLDKTNLEIIKWILLQLSKININVPPLLQDLGAIAFNNNKRKLFLSTLMHGRSYYLKQIEGKWHIIFKGKAGTRKFLTATHYPIEHPKMALVAKYVDARVLVNEGIVTNDLAKDSIIGVILIAPLDVLKYYEDKDKHKELSDLFVKIEMDYAKYFVAKLITLAIVAASLAIAKITIPLYVIAAAGIAIDFGVVFGLDWLDEHVTHTTKKLELWVRNTKSAEFINHHDYYHLTEKLISEIASSVNLLRFTEFYV
ncbi:MAG: hypothetical protein KAT71_01235, partial [Gammaproteobacteria bacterium]|nr:hypothetical protein [Gammaproteobacteria bacterium]